MSTPRSVPFVLLALAFAACGGEPKSPPPVAAALTSEQLAAHFRSMVEAAKAQDVAAIKALVGALIPSRSDLRSVLRPGAEAEAWLKAYDGPTTESFKPEEAARAGLGSSTRTEIFVHQTTTEELAAYERGTTAFREFPGGMKRFAQTVSAPGLAWWCVEAREPGKEDGTRFTAFTQAGRRFVMVVKPWRALPKESSAGEAHEAGTPVEGPK